MKTLSAMLVIVFLCTTTVLAEKESSASYADLQQTISSTVKKAVPFDQYISQKYTDIDLNLTEKVYNQRKAAIAKKAKEMADEEYTKEQFKKVLIKAKQEYQVYKIGDKVTLPVRYGRGFRDFKGKLESVSPEVVVVDGKRIPRIDLPERIIAKLDPQVAKTKIKAYIFKNFIKAKRSYEYSIKRDLEADLYKKYDKSLRIQYKLPKERQKYNRNILYGALKSNLTNYFEQKLKTCEAQKTAKEKFEMYNSLVSEARMAIKEYGRPAQKLLRKVMDLNRIEDKVLPDLERKAALEKRSGDSKPAAPKKVYYSGLG